MNSNEIIQILADWNFWYKDLDIGVKRDTYQKQLLEYLSADFIITLIGPRRAGKSYVMRQLAKHLMDMGTPKENILMVNLEDPRFNRLDTVMLQQIYEAYLTHLNPQGSDIYIFLDEVQEVAQWEKWLLMMHALKKAKLIISGSNAHLLSQELGTYLTGRHLDIAVHPLSFQEFLQFNQIQLTGPIDWSDNQVVLQRQLLEYMQWGAFPEVVCHQAKQAILLGYYDDIVTRDLIRRYQIRNVYHLKDLAKYYLTHMAALSTYSSLEKSLGFSADTIEKFTYYMQQIYLIYSVPSFSYQLKQQIKTARKIYAIDVGLANVVGFRFSNDTGRLLENLVFLTLNQQKYYGFDQEIYYWKDAQHHEVDFLIRSQQRHQALIQVCMSTNNPLTLEREVRSLEKAMQFCALESSTIITLEDKPRKIDCKTGVINSLPIYQWLCG